MSVPRGQPAVMACNISNTFSRIAIRLRAHGRTVTIFEEQPPGRFSRGGWKLQVHGGQARLVITAAQDAHAGQYLWHLQGLQRTNRATYLNVSGEAGPGRGQSQGQAGGWARGGAWGGAGGSWGLPTGRGGGQGAGAEQRAESRAQTHRRRPES